MRPNPALVAFRDTVLALVGSEHPDMTQRQLAALLFCGTARDLPTIRTVASTLGVSCTTASRCVTLLEERGYVERMLDPSDRRQVLVGMRPDGQAYVQFIQTKASSAYVMSGVQ